MFPFSLIPSTWINSFSTWATHAFESYWRRRVTSAISSWLTQHVWLEILLLVVVLMVITFFVTALCGSCCERVQHWNYIRKETRRMEASQYSAVHAPAHPGSGATTFESDAVMGHADDMDDNGRGGEDKSFEPPRGTPMEPISTCSPLHVLAYAAVLCALWFRWGPAVLSSEEAASPSWVDAALNAVTIEMPHTTGATAASHQADMQPFQAMDYMAHGHHYRRKEALEGWTIVSCTDMRIDTGPTWVAFHPTRLHNDIDSEDEQEHYATWASTTPSLYLQHATTTTPFTLLEPVYTGSLNAWHNQHVHTGAAYYYASWTWKNRHTNSRLRLPPKGVSSFSHNVFSDHTEVITPNPGVRPLHFRNVVWAALRVLADSSDNIGLKAPPRLWVNRHALREMEGYGFACDNGTVRLESHADEPGTPKHRDFSYNGLEHVLFQIEQTPERARAPQRLSQRLASCSRPKDNDAFAFVNTITCRERLELPSRVHSFFDDIAASHAELHVQLDPDDEEGTNRANVPVESIPGATIQVEDTYASDNNDEL